jgi:hypothetical protein
MNTEFIGEKAFFDEVHENGHIWLAMQGENVHMNKGVDGTIILLAWANQNKSQAFLDHVNLDYLQPVEWPVAYIINLFEQVSQIEAIAVNPTGQSNQILTYNVDEFTTYLSKSTAT